MKIPRKISAPFCIMALATLLSRSPAEGGAWTQGAGHSYVSIVSSRYTSSSYWDANGNLHDATDGEFSKWEYRIYAEYGLDDVNTLTFNLPYQRLRKDAPSDRSNSGTGDIEIGWRRLLRKSDFDVSSFQITAGRAAGNERDALPRGTNASYLDLRALWAHSFAHNGGYGYINVELAYRLLEGEYADQARIDATFFLPMSARWGIQASLNGIESLQGGSFRRSDGTEFSREYALWKAGIGPVLKFDGGSASLIYIRDLDGRNTGKGENFELTLGFDLGGSR